MKAKKIDEYMTNEFKDIFFTLSKDGIDLEILELLLSFYFSDNVEIFSSKFDLKKFEKFLKDIKNINF